MPKTTQRASTDESTALAARSPQKTNVGSSATSPTKTPRDRRRTTAQVRRGSPKNDVPNAPAPNREIAKLKHRKFPSL